MKNVLFCKTHKTNGRAWAAWAIKPESAEQLEYVVSVNGKETTVYAVNDFVPVRFIEEDGTPQNYDRVAFDLTNINDSKVAETIVKNNGDLFGRGWVIKFGTSHVQEKPKTLAERFLGL